ncbi:DNA helicase MCM8 [Lingula anatina]|uniref:DNA helicase MCM8 n=1 Tax=Lingula anatina TaxID=7574 RepID=A0A1S3JYB5_LINAN|nr:DNA helicase MCM8 [Lingula anatina]XP_013415384.1 DNA helicase MCM8 [Lingula anatina]XP_013415385.1 DNA helicase MCM8 [Lingula anatina]|eukprot:XP_013415383.1 DNA helicase MCM8 [Lingula anatina]
MSQSSGGPGNGNWRGGRGNWRGGRGNWGGGHGNWRGGQGNWRGGRGNWRGGRGNWRGRGGYFNHYGRGREGAAGGPPKPTSSQPRVVQAMHPSPYKGWRFYFPEEAYSPHSPTVTRVQVFEKYFINWKALYNAENIESKGHFTVDFKELCQDPVIQDGLSDLAALLKEMPEQMVNAIGLALHQVLSSGLEQDVQGDSEDPFLPPLSAPYSLPVIHARILNHEPITQLKNLKAHYYGKFVSVKGTVVRVSNIKPLCTKMAFECNSCRTVQSVILPDGKYVVPTKCVNTNCKARTFIPLRSSHLTETIDWQTIRVQEIITDDMRDSGRIPRTVDCELTNDLVDSCVPGDIVTVSGIVKVTSTEKGRGRNKDKCMFLLYLHANSVNNSKGPKSGAGEQGLAIDFTLKELYAIEEIQSEKKLFRLIVGSLCPSIYGHEMVKAGLVLGLFGGSQKYANDKNRIPVRGDPHILVVGDPGLGKSQMLQAVAGVAPRSVYVCGNTTTSSGLTVTLSKEGGSGDYALEAGALVLADQGCCCIDEFDKMGSQHQALLEAMEQQSISIAKAGIVCSLPARTSILAAANPVGGHYNKGKTVSENLKMGSALLSRFDLVFILLDKPDEEMDSMLSEHVMAMHAGKKRILQGTTARRNQEQNEAYSEWEADKPLSERIKVPRGENLDVIPPQLLRKYVGYARKYVHPKITKEAAKVIQQFYLDLRKQHQSRDSTPITTRQLESLIRLTEARARLELREEATEHDAKDVVDIMKFSMIDTYSNELGFLDFERSQHGSGMSSKAQGKRLIAALQKMSETTYNSLFTVQEMRQIAQSAGIQVRDFEDFISSLNNQGFLLKKGPRVYQLQTAGF